MAVLIVLLWIAYLALNALVQHARKYLGGEIAMYESDTLAAILGHGSLRVVQKYVHPTADHKKQAMRKFEQAVLETEAEFPQAQYKNQLRKISDRCPVFVRLRSRFSLTRVH